MKKMLAAFAFMLMLGAVGLAGAVATSAPAAAGDVDW